VIDGWHWAAAAIVAVLLTIMVLLWYDSLRERPGWTTARATKRALVGAIVIPVGFLLALLLPIWVGGALSVILLIALGAMALVD
jgi:hypothetical protein